MKKLAIIWTLLLWIVLTGCGTQTTENWELSNCAVYNDWCKDCIVIDWELWDCKFKPCLDQWEPKCVKTLDELESELQKEAELKKLVDLEGCSLYFDWCNDCMVEDWELLWCTKKACVIEQEPYCKKVSSEWEMTEEKCLDKGWDYIVDWEWIWLCSLLMEDADEVCTLPTDCESWFCVVADSQNSEVIEWKCYNSNVIQWCKDIILNDWSIATSCDK